MPISDISAIADIFLFRVRYTLSRLSNHVRCYHVASKTPAKISDREKLRPLRIAKNHLHYGKFLAWLG